MIQSPLSVPESPSATTKNLTGLPRVAKDIAADVYNSIQKWNDSHIKGASIVKKIIQIKCEGKTSYPSGLEELIGELDDIIHKLSVHANSLTFLSHQMLSLSRLHRQQSLFITLTAQELAILVENIAKAYKAELMVNIPYCYLNSLLAAVIAGKTVYSRKYWAFKK